MKKWTVIAGLALAICGIGIIGYIGVFGNTAPADVSYHGKPLSYWFQPWRTLIESAVVSTDIALPRTGGDDINPDAIPFLVKNLQYRQSLCSRISGLVWRWLPIPPTKRSSWIQPVPEEIIRRNAQGLLSLSKHDSKASVPVLVKEYQKGDAEVRSALAGVLGEIGGHAMEALPVLRTSLLSPNAGERTAAEKAIANIEGASAPMHK